MIGRSVLAVCCLCLISWQSLSLPSVNAVTPAGYGTTNILTAAELATVTADIVATFGLVPAYGIPCNPCTLGDNIGAMVRLAFHDIIGGGGPIPAVGGANGCNDPLHGEKGLEAVLASYANIQRRHADKISIADLWVLGAQVAIGYASTPATTTAAGGRGGRNGGGGGGGGNVPASPGRLNLPFMYGRRDDATCLNADTAFLATINAGMSWTQLFQIFGHRVNLTVQETVAIMGAHSLGRCQAANSGFEGGWTQFQSSFSSLYYSSMADIPWRQRNTSSPVWNAAGGVIMIGVDMIPLFSTPYNGRCPRFNSFTSCTQNTAEGRGEPAASVIRFAGSMSAWFTAFASAWAKFSALGYLGKLAPAGSALPA
jgi:hypothetical protein